MPPYVDALVEEIRSGGKMVRETGLRVRSFYMGGGTPTTLSAEQMDRVLTAFEEAFDRGHCDEITVEAGRPDTITAEKLAVLKAHGVTRVSVNPQTMEDHVLRAIGRRHTAADIEAAMELVAGYGFPHVNMDLIAGLPGGYAGGLPPFPGPVSGLRHRQRHGPHAGAQKGQPHSAGGPAHPRPGGCGGDAGLRGPGAAEGRVQSLLPLPAKVHVRQL